MQTVPLTPGDYWDIIKRRKWSLILIAVFIMTLTCSVALLIPSIYRSYSTIMIEEQHIPSDFVMTTVNTYAEQRVENIKQRVLSFTQLWEIINQYNLYGELKKKFTAEEIVDKMRSDVLVETLSAEIFDRKTGRPSSVTTSFSVAYEGKNPASVLRVTDTITSLFLQQNLEVRQQQISDTSNFLATEAKRIQEELAETESKVAEFKMQHINALPELFQVNMQGLNSTERTIEQLNSELRSLKERESYLSAQLSGISPYVESMENQNKTADTLRELKLQLSQLQQRYTEKYPDIVSLKDQIQALEWQRAEDVLSNTYASKENSVFPLPDTDINISKQVGLPDNPAFVTLSSNLASVESDIKSVRVQVKRFEDRSEEYRKRIEETPRVEETYVSLVNQRDALEKKYRDLTQKHQEARVAQELEKDQKGERFTLVEPARLPEKPYKPNRIAIVLIGFVLAIGGSIGFAAIREFSDQSVRSVDALFALTGVPVLAGISKITTARERTRKKRKLIIMIILFILLLLGAITLFHYYVMDIDIFLSKVSRRLDRL